MSPNDESLNKIDELGLSLEEYLTDYAATPSAKNMGFLQHFSRYEFFAKRILSSPETISDKEDLTEKSLKGIKILDAGCGEGFGSNFLAGLGAEVTGIDFHEAVINHARSNYPAKNLQFTAGDACELDFPDSSFDGVCGMDLIEHLESPQKFIAEAKRVLKENGLLMFSTPNYLKHLIKIGGIYPFHKREYLYSEFKEFAERYFKRYEIYGQCPDCVANVSDSVRENDFTRASLLKIVGFKLGAFFKRAVSANIKRRLYQKLNLNSDNIAYDAIKANANYQSIRFVKERYETCSDFIVAVSYGDIQGV